MLEPRLSNPIADDSREVPGEAEDIEAAVVARARLLTALPESRRTRRARDLLLWELVTLYRRGQRQLWAPLLLDVMEQALVHRLHRYQAPDPTFDAGDIAQQLVIEVLEAALDIPLPAEPVWIEARLLKRATKRLQRWLAKEAKRQSRQQPPPAPDEDESADPERWD
jgi:hypothetical protein